MGLIGILTESGATSKAQQDLAKSKVRLEQSVADYAKQVEEYNKWTDYVIELMPKLEAVAAKFPSEPPFVHKTGVSFNLKGNEASIDKARVMADCAPFKVKIEAVNPNWVQVHFVLERKPKFPHAKVLEAGV